MKDVIQKIGKRKYKIFLHSLYAGLGYNLCIAVVKAIAGKDIIIPALAETFFGTLVVAIVIGNVGEHITKIFKK